MRISDWSSDVCSSDLGGGADLRSKLGEPPILDAAWCSPHARKTLTGGFNKLTPAHRADLHPAPSRARTIALYSSSVCRTFSSSTTLSAWPVRSEEHTSELQSLMRISYAVFCLKKKKKHTTYDTNHTNTNNRNTIHTTKHTSYHNVDITQHT